MSVEIKTSEEAVNVIGAAREVFVSVRVSVSCDGNSHHTVEFPVSKDLAIAAINEVRDLEHQPNVVVLEDGAKVVLGRHITAPSLPSLGHNEDNNGNF